MESLLRTSSTPVDFAEGMRAVVKGQDHVIRTIARLMYKGIQEGRTSGDLLGLFFYLEQQVQVKLNWRNKQQNNCLVVKMR